MRESKYLYWSQKSSLILIGLLIIFSSIPSAIGQDPPKGASDDKPMNDLRVTPGKVLVEGRNKMVTGPRGLLTYRIEEVALPQAIEVSLFGKREHFDTVIRLTITGKSIWTAKVIWIDDARLTGVWSQGSGKIGTLIYDRSVLKDGAVISVQDDQELYSLPELLKLPEILKASVKPAAEEGNAIVAVHSALRIIGSVRQPLVQIELRTNRPFPVRNAALQVQIGKQFFLNELGADPGGHTLTVSITPKVFAELKEGAEVLAGFSFDRSGAHGEEIWYFGRLNKSMLDR